MPAIKRAFTDIFTNGLILARLFQRQYRECGRILANNFGFFPVAANFHPIAIRSKADRLRSCALLAPGIV